MEEFLRRPELPRVARLSEHLLISNVRSYKVKRILGGGGVLEVFPQLDPCQYLRRKKFIIDFQKFHEYSMIWILDKLKRHLETFLVAGSHS